MRDFPDETNPTSSSISNREQAGRAIERLMFLAAIESMLFTESVDELGKNLKRI